MRDCQSHSQEFSGNFARFSLHCVAGIEITLGKSPREEAVV